MGDFTVTHNSGKTTFTNFLRAQWSKINFLLDKFTFCSRSNPCNGWGNGWGGGWGGWGGWVGPVFWPYAYYDLFDYVYWPYAYDDFWPYAYDDVYYGIYGPYAYSGRYGYRPYADPNGYYAGRSARRGSSRCPTAGRVGSSRASRC